MPIKYYILNRHIINNFSKSIQLEMNLNLYIFNSKANTFNM